MKRRGILKGLCAFAALPSVQAPASTPVDITDYVAALSKLNAIHDDAWSRGVVPPGIIRVGDVVTFVGDQTVWLITEETEGSQ